MLNGKNPELLFTKKTLAIAAISALTKKRGFWVVSLVFGAVGCVFLVLAAMTR